MRAVSFSIQADQRGRETLLSLFAYPTPYGELDEFSLSRRMQQPLAEKSTNEKATLQMSAAFDFFQSDGLSDGQS